jgi:hypothetical protein
MKNKNVSYEKDCQHFTEFEEFISLLKEQAAGPFPEPDKSNPFLTTTSCSFVMCFDILLPSTSRALLAGLLAMYRSFVYVSVLPNTCHVIYPSYHPLVLSGNHEASPYEVFSIILSPPVSLSLIQMLSSAPYTWAF